MKSDNDHIWNRDFFMTKFLKKIHTIMVSDRLQLVFHKNLHVNLHYSISKRRNLILIHAFGNFAGIDFIVYNADTTYVDFDGVVVLNNFE